MGAQHERRGFFEVHFTIYTTRSRSRHNFGIYNRETSLLSIAILHDTAPKERFYTRSMDEIGGGEIPYQSAGNCLVVESWRYASWIQHRLLGSCGVCHQSSSIRSIELVLVYLGLQ